METLLEEQTAQKQGHVHWSEALHFEVHGHPGTAGSKKVGFNKKTGKAFACHDSPHTRPWMNDVAACAYEAHARRAPLQGPVRLGATFRFLRPKSHYRTGSHAGELRDDAPHFCITIPDLDKCIRAICDAMTGIVWRDDAQVASLNCQKVYAQEGEGEGEGVRIIIYMPS